MEVQIPVISQAKCSAAFESYKHLRIDESVLCAGLDEGGKDACRVNCGFFFVFFYTIQSYVLLYKSFDKCRAILAVL